ncbi:hypothetical protein NIES4071_105820 (plasmid) [Calothrix sp. NIES-4071]|nr:hypothetical protein NIES4071_105820 [Calothrix sp. NIES-4071]BAZ65000.1 hypothetical protein NIES4105_107330 [Calothrix sp. NIES-4105]
MSNFCLGSASKYFLYCSLAISSIGVGIAPSLAQVEVPFNAVYDLSLLATPITTEVVSEPVLKVTATGTSVDAPYGLTNIARSSYSRFDFTTRIRTEIPDAAQFGLNGLPILTDSFFGSGDNKLFGTSKLAVVPDLQELTALGEGTFTITGGTGQFASAFGTLQILNTYTLNSDPTRTVAVRSSISGSIQTSQKVSEPNYCIGVAFLFCGASLFLKQRRKSILLQCKA